MAKSRQDALAIVLQPLRGGVALVLSSISHENGTFYMPQCDLRVAGSIQDLLDEVEFHGEVQVVPAQEAAGKPYWLAKNLFLICGVARNQVSRDAQELLQGERFSLLGDPGKWWFLRKSDSTKYELSIAVTGDQVDWARVARFQNPWGPDSSLFLFWGLRTESTALVASALKRDDVLAVIADNTTAAGFDVLLRFRLGVGGTFRGVDVVP